MPPIKARKRLVKKRFGSQTFRRRGMEVWTTEPVGQGSVGTDMLESGCRRKGMGREVDGRGERGAKCQS